MHPQRGTKALIRHVHNHHEAEWKLLLAASSRSTKSQRAETLVEAFTLSKKIQQQYYHIVVPTFTLYALGISDR